MSYEPYPTFVKEAPDRYVSEQTRDGYHDFVIMRDRKTKRWHVRWRTSKHWSPETYDTVKAAIAGIRSNLGAP